MNCRSAPAALPPVAKSFESNEQLLCSFSGKSQRQVEKLIAGPGVCPVQQVIDLTNEIIDEELAARSAATKNRFRPGRVCPTS